MPHVAASTLAVLIAVPLLAFVVWRQDQEWTGRSCDRVASMEGGIWQRPAER